MKRRAELSVPKARETTLAGKFGEAERSQLLALYKETDALLSPFSCPASADCCHFARTGREPYPQAVEMAEVDYAVRALGAPKKKLAIIDDERTCPLLGEGGRCRIYASRPFGCRTYFCEKIEGGKLPRAKVQELGRRIADLSARAFPRDPGPRALSRALKK